jgi:hypothetical protein
MPSQLCAANAFVEITVLAASDIAIKVLFGLKPACLSFIQIPIFNLLLF